MNSGSMLGIFASGDALAALAAASTRARTHDPDAAPTSRGAMAAELDLGLGFYASGPSGDSENTNS